MGIARAIDTARGGVGVQDPPSRDRPSGRQIAEQRPPRLRPACSPVSPQPVHLDMIITAGLPDTTTILVVLSNGSMACSRSLCVPSIDLSWPHTRLYSRVHNREMHEPFSPDPIVPTSSSIHTFLHATTRLPLIRRSNYPARQEQRCFASDPSRNKHVPMESANELPKRGRTSNVPPHNLIITQPSRYKLPTKLTAYIRPETPLRTPGCYDDDSQKLSPPLESASRKRWTNLPFLPHTGP